MGEKNKLGELVTEKMIMIHAIVIVAVCTVFGVINLFTNNVPIGLITIAAGVATFLPTVLLKNKIPKITRGVVISQVQLIIIIVMSVTKHELHTMFPLLLASMTMAAVYYSVKSLYIHWIIMDVASVIGIFFHSFFYGECDIVTIIKGLAGINIGAVLLMYLVKTNLKNIKKAMEAYSESEGLLGQVQQKMDESKRMVEQQNDVVAKIADISASVNSSSGKMREISSQISASSTYQQTAIEEISGEVKNIINQTGESLNEATEAEKAANNCAKLIRENYDAMKNMGDAMDEIRQSSQQIKTIIEAIEDIAFQTNILALNAAIEAARAGDAGKGFAIVADEVGVLASKSSQSAENTAELIQSSIDSVERGAAIAEEVLNQMNSVITTAEKSAHHAVLINDLSHRQAESTAAVERSIQQISEIVAKNVQTSDESSRIAEQVANEATKMDEVVSTFR